MDNDFILEDRLAKIQQIIYKYGVDNFFISFSGGKDSCVLSSLIDLALPNNNIPRVFADTGIELNLIRDFVYSLSLNDNRFVIIKPSTPIKKTLDLYGYPFKSKNHSHVLDIFQRNGVTYGVSCYLGLTTPKSGIERTRNHLCPKLLKYQFSDTCCSLRVSDKCCFYLKKLPIHKWQVLNNKPYSILGVRREEGGQRENSKCLAFSGKSLKAFQPLVVITQDWEDWFINTYNVSICNIYKPPYNFERTGCKGCPFNINLQHELDILQIYFPNERKQCEIIWKPVYKEYRRLGYRLINDLVSNFYDNILGGA